MPGHNTNALKCPRVDAAAAAEDEAYGKIAPALLKKKGFDPNDVSKEKKTGWTPMIYFCKMGNLKMIRYLAFRGANCQTSDRSGWFPMYVLGSNGWSFGDHQVPIL